MFIEKGSMILNETIKIFLFFLLIICNLFFIPISLAYNPSTDIAVDMFIFNDPPYISEIVPENDSSTGCMPIISFIPNDVEDDIFSIRIYTYDNGSWVIIKEYLNIYQPFDYLSFKYFNASLTDTTYYLKFNLTDIHNTNIYYYEIHTSFQYPFYEAVHPFKWHVVAIGLLFMLISIILTIKLSKNKNQKFKQFLLIMFLIFSFFLTTMAYNSL